MVDQPLVSVVIPTYCRSQMIAQAIESAALQSYKNIEIIVVDDNQDFIEQQKLRHVLATLSTKVKLIGNKRIKGGCGARNTGILEAKGEYIAFLDDDDIWLPQKIELQVNLISDTSYVGVVCNYVDIDESFQHARVCEMSTPELHLEQALAGECPTSTSLMLLRRDVLLNAGLFDESLPSFQDYDMWLRCLAHGAFCCEKTALVKFVQHNGERTSVNLSRRMKGLDAVEEKWGKDMAKYQNVSLFRRRVKVDALIANGKANFGKKYLVALRFFIQAVFADRFSIKSLFWLCIALSGKHLGSMLYMKSITVRGINVYNMQAVGFGKTPK